MKEMTKQMEMFQDGGLKDEGGTKDPVSGNDVPLGATQEELSLIHISEPTRRS